MQKIISGLYETIEKYYPLLQSISKNAISEKPADKWSHKEELGHLIDSALNNIQRFIRVQYEEHVHIMYNPDNWVSFNDYQNRDSKQLIELWYLLNKQIVSILQKMPKDKHEALMCFEKDASVKNSTLFVAEDYVKHMTHHLENIVTK